MTQGLSGSRNVAPSIDLSDLSVYSVALTSLLHKIVSRDLAYFVKGLNKLEDNFECK